MPRKELYQRSNGFLRLGLITTGILMLVSAMIMSSLPEPVSAAPGDLSSAVTKYPNLSGTILQQCGLCHTSPPTLNPYGAAYKAAGRNFAAFAAIESLDSDKDGFTNLQEILSLTFPGDSTNFPVLPTATNTSVPPTATATATATSIPATPTATSIPPTATFTSIPATATATSVPPTATFTSVPATATATSIPPTATFTAMPPTAIPPTVIPPTATFTAVPPTAIPTNTSQPATMTAVPTVIPPVPGTFDLRIIYFAVPSDVELAEAKPMRIWLVVQNTGQVDGQAIATLVGVENGVEFYRSSMSVTDPVGGGYTSFLFPGSTPLVAGKIIWTVTLVNGAKVDVRVGTTEVEGRDSHDDGKENHYHRSDH